MKSYLALAVIALSLVAAPAAMAEKPHQPKTPAVQQYQQKVQAPAPKQDVKPAHGRMIYRGNPKSMTYHNSDCRFFNEGPDSVVIRGAADAKAKGFHPCKVCGGAEGPVMKQEAPKKPEPKAQPKQQKMQQPTPQQPQQQKKLDSRSFSL